MRRAVMLGFLGALFSTGAFAEESTVALRDVTAVQDGRGSARVLFRVGALPAFEEVFVESAVLTIPYAGVVGRASGGASRMPGDRELAGRVNS